MKCINTLIKDNGCDHDTVYHLVDWCVNYPTEISMRIRKYAIKSIIGLGEDLPAKDITITKTELADLNFLDYTAEVLYDVACAKAKNTGSDH